MNVERINGRHRQGGMTLIGFVLVAAVVGFFIYIGIRLFPMYSEYYSVKSALRSLSTEPGIAGQSPARIQEMFFRKLYISYAQNVKKEHVKVKRSGAGWEIDVQYEVRKPLLGNLDVVGRFSASQTLSRTGAE